MDVLSRMAKAGVVPVVVLEKAEDAVPTAKAMLAGGIDVMEITFRTAAAADSIRAVAQEVPDMLVGAGTVINLEQCKLAVECGAKFIVAPGYDEETVAWCVENGVVYGGLKALKALSGPFPGTKFIPTGGVNNDNLAEFITSPVIHAVGGSWTVPAKEIAAGNFEKVTELCAEARKVVVAARGE